jgi:Immunoglobulin I-set domain
MQQAKVIKAEEEQKVLRNENSLRLSCVVQGNPMPIVSWISNGHILSTTSKLNLEKLFKTMQDSTIYFNGFGNSITYLDPFKVKQSNDKFYSQLTKIDGKSLKLELVFRIRDVKIAGNYQCYGKFYYFYCIVSSD